MQANCGISFICPFLGTNWLYETVTSVQPSSAVLYYYQFGMSKSPKLHIMGKIMEHITELPFYVKLRTEEQLGYHVETSAVSHGPTTGFTFLVQGQKHPAYVFTRIENYIDSFVVEINNMTEGTFQKHKQSYLSVFKRSIPSTFDARFTSVWEQITNEQMDFEADDRHRDELRALTLREFQQFVNVSSEF